MKSEMLRLSHEQSTMKEKIKDNEEKVKLNKQLPYLVANVVEVLFFLSFLTLKSSLIKIPLKNLKKMVQMWI